MKKTVFTLNVNGYSPEITEMTFPLLKFWANKIGADFYIIKDRKFPNWPVTYEKLQIYELGQEMQNDWNIYVDADAVVHPEAFDWTMLVKKDTIAHNDVDMAFFRWRYNKYFLRDGRNWGAANWFTMASDWCIDVWKPLEMTPNEAFENIFPTLLELNGNVTRDHLIDDYALSYNIAKYGIKATTLVRLQEELKLPQKVGFYWHMYNISEADKITQMREIIGKLNLPDSIRYYGVKR